MDTNNKLSRITVNLHWLVAFGMIGLTAIGFYMVNFEAWDLYTIHKSLGVLILALVLPRVIWRIKNGWPPAAGNYSAIEHRLAVVVHWLLILATVLMPLSGMLYSGASGHGFGVFSWTIVPGNHSPTDATQVIPRSEFWSYVGETTHTVLGYLLATAIALHIIGAVKHHIIDKDNTLTRMLGKTARDSDTSQD